MVLGPLSYSTNFILWTKWYRKTIITGLDYVSVVFYASVAGQFDIEPFVVQKFIAYNSSNNSPRTHITLCRTVRRRQFISDNSLLDISLNISKMESKYLSRVPKISGRSYKIWTNETWYTDTDSSLTTSYSITLSYQGFFKPKWITSFHTISIILKHNLYESLGLPKTLLTAFSSLIRDRPLDHFPSHLL